MSRQWQTGQMVSFGQVWLLSGNLKNSNVSFYSAHMPWKQLHLPQSDFLSLALPHRHKHQWLFQRTESVAGCRSDTAACVTQSTAWTTVTFHKHKGCLEKRGPGGDGHKVSPSGKGRRGIEANTGQTTSSQALCIVAASRRYIWNITRWISTEREPEIFNMIKGKRYIFNFYKHWVSRKLKILQLLIMCW